MNSLFKPIKLKSVEIKNRVVLPPMVCFGWAEENGFVNDCHVTHYEKIAEGGAGIIIVEATCVEKNGRIIKSQLGIWSDNHIEGLRKITTACRAYGAIMLLQIHHSGLVTSSSIADKAVGPSVDPNNSRTHALSLAEIHDLQNAFTSAAIRAKQAGFHGVELHGAHGYLLNQFATPAINKREDEYGQTLAGRLKFASAIIEGIRKSLGDDFIIGYRLGSNSPTLADGIEIAQYLEIAGVDIIHASHGGQTGIIPDVPENFAYNGIVYSGTEIKKHVNIPVIVVNEIKTPERASYLIEHQMADFTAIGKDMLTDPRWVKKAMNNEPIDYCIHCQPKCKRYENPDLCPVFKG
ncbi:MAG TPA: NADH:flavin oxidoreductase [Candidatus Kapabacteria bacterium]|nr:NADH:flavin oxidoreductase [Candidatus Kapabacteria bacterium]